MQPFPSPLDPLPHEEKIYSQVDEAEQYIADSLSEMYEDAIGAADVAYALLDKANSDVRKGINVKVSQAERKLRGALADMGLPTEDISPTAIARVLKVAAPPGEQIVGPPYKCAVLPGMDYWQCIQINPNNPECCIGLPGDPNTPPPPPPPPPPEPPPPCPPGQIYDPEKRVCLFPPADPCKGPNPPDYCLPPEPEPCCPQQVIQIQCPTPAEPYKPPTAGCCPTEDKVCVDDEGNETVIPGVKCDEQQTLLCCPELSPCAPQSLVFNADLPLNPPGQEHYLAPCGSREMFQHFAASEPTSSFMRAKTPSGLTEMAWSASVGTFDSQPDTLPSSYLYQV